MLSSAIRPATGHATTVSVINGWYSPRCSKLPTGNAAIRAPQTSTLRPLGRAGLAERAGAGPLPLATEVSRLGTARRADARVEALA